MKKDLYSLIFPSKSDLLRPEALDSLAQSAAAALMSEGESKNTRRSYESALRYWAGWFKLRYGSEIALPVAIETVVQFIVDHAQRTSAQGLRSELPASVERALIKAGLKAKSGPLSLSTIEHRIAALSRVHAMWSHPNPCQSGPVRELMTMTRRAYAKRGRVSSGAPALTKDRLERLIEVCDQDTSLAGVRDKALLLFAWSSGGRRRSEITWATMDTVIKVSESHYEYHLPYSKTNQTGRNAAENVKPIMGTAAFALSAWIRAAELSSGPLFRRVLRGGHIGEGLSPAGVNRIVKVRSEQAGLSGEFSAHSLRSGFVTEAGKQNVPIAQAMALTGHASTRTFLGYFRAGELSQSKAAGLFDNDSNEE